MRPYLTLVLGGLVVMPAVGHATAARREPAPLVRITRMAGPVALQPAGGRIGPCRKGSWLKPGDSLWLETERARAWLTMRGVNGGREFLLQGPQWWPVPRTVSPKAPPQSRCAGAERGARAADYRDVVAQYGAGVSTAEQVASLPRNPFTKVGISLRVLEALPAADTRARTGSQPTVPARPVSALVAGRDYVLQLTNRGPQESRAWVFEVEPDGGYRLLWPRGEASSSNRLPAKQGPVICQRPSADGAAVPYLLTPSSPGRTSLRVLALRSGLDNQAPIPMSAWEAITLPLTIGRERGSLPPAVRTKLPAAE